MGRTILWRRRLRGGEVGEDVGDGPVCAVEGEPLQHAQLAQQLQAGEPGLLRDLAPCRRFDGLTRFDSALGDDTARPVSLARQRHQQPLVLHGAHQAAGGEPLRRVRRAPVPTGVDHRLHGDQHNGTRRATPPEAAVPNRAEPCRVGRGRGSVRGSGFQVRPLRPMLWVEVYSLRPGIVVHQYRRVTAAAVAQVIP